MHYSLKRLMLLNLLGIVCYISTVYLSQVLFDTTAILPAAGIAFAFVMLFGFRAAPIILVGTLFAVSQFIYSKGNSPLSSGSISMILITMVGDTAAILVSVWLLKKVVSEDTPFFSLKGVIVFAFVGAGLSAIIAALFGVGAIWLAGYSTREQVNLKVIEWMIGDYLGILILAPPILLWWRDHSIPPRHTRLELFLVALSVLFVVFLVFGPLYKVAGPQIGQPVLLMLPLAWSAVRLRLRVTTLFIAVACLLMWCGTTQGYGVFHVHGGTVALTSSQTFLATLAITTLLMATLAHGNQRRARELKVEQERMKLALDVANVAIWDRNLETGENYSCLWLEQLGYVEGEIPNTNETWSNLLHPDDIERVQQYNTEYRQRGRKGEYQLEYRLLHKDGNYRWILTRTNESLFVAEPSQRSTGIMVDQTRWKQDEKKYRDNLFILESLERISHIIWEESTFDEHLQKMMDDVLETFHSDRAWLLYPCDPDAPTWSVPFENTTPEFPGAFQLGDELEMNSEVASLMSDLLAVKDIQVFDPSTILEIPAPEHFSVQSQICMAITPRIGKPWMFGLHQCTHPRVWSERDKRLFRELGYRIADGLSSLLLLRDLEQQVLKRTEELNERNEELEAFAHTVSHDLRAPLRAMHGFAAALQEDYAEQFDETAIDYSQRIVGAANHMDGLICDLLEYSSLGRIELNPKPINLNSIMKKCLAQLQSEIEQKEAIIEVAEPLPSVLGHKTLVEQITMNLLTNGLKFVEPGNQPCLKIWAERKKACIIVWFEDNGIGVSEEHQEKIFSVFERLHGIERYPGTGIGLAIVRRAVERMEGEVGVISSPQTGSRFWISLPCAD